MKGEDRRGGSGEKAGGRRRWREEEEEDMDEVDEVFANGEEVQSDLKKKLSSARARLQYPNRETPAPLSLFQEPVLPNMG